MNYFSSNFIKFLVVLGELAGLNGFECKTYFV